MKRCARRSPSLKDLTLQQGRHGRATLCCIDRGLRRKRVHDLGDVATGFAEHAQGPSEALNLRRHVAVDRCFAQRSAKRDRKGVAQAEDLVEWIFDRAHTTLQHAPHNENSAKENSHNRMSARRGRRCQASDCEFVGCMRALRSRRARCGSLETTGRAVESAQAHKGKEENTCRLKACASADSSAPRARLSPVVLRGECGCACCALAEASETAMRALLALASFALALRVARGVYSSSSSTSWSSLSSSTPSDCALISDADAFREAPPFCFAPAPPRVGLARDISDLKTQS